MEPTICTAISERNINNSGTHNMYCNFWNEYKQLSVSWFFSSTVQGSDGISIMENGIWIMEYI